MVLHSSEAINSWGSNDPKKVFGMGLEGVYIAVATFASRRSSCVCREEDEEETSHFPHGSCSQKEENSLGN